MGDISEVWEAVLDADFLFGALPRGLRGPCLRDLESRGEWVQLEADPPHEVAFGAVGRFWAGETVWEQIDADEFASVGGSGMAKIACSFSLRLCEERRTLVTYESRTLATDPSARREVLHYWRALSPFIGFVLRAQLRTIETTLEEASNRR